MEHDSRTSGSNANTIEKIQISAYLAAIPACDMYIERLIVLVALIIPPLHTSRKAMSLSSAYTVKKKKIHKVLDL